MGDPFLFQRGLSGGSPYGAAQAVMHAREADEAVNNPGAPHVLDPVTLDEAKAHLNIRHGWHDAEIARMVTAAREAIERRYGLALLRQTVTATFRGGASYADLPVEPVHAVTGASRTGYTGTQAYAAGDVLLSGSRVSLLSRQALAHGGDTLTVTYTAGYGLTPGSVPQALRSAVLVWVDDLYRHRGSFTTGSLAVVEMPGGVAALLSDFRRWAA